MDTPQMCVVLGAGASHPYWYPLGEQLKEELCMVGVKHGGKAGRILQLATLLQEVGFTVDDITKFQKSLSGSPQRSIDRFLELRREFEVIGKAAIAALIIFYETNCIYERRRDGEGDLLPKF
jgi:hypothetical protein